MKEISRPEVPESDKPIVEQNIKKQVNFLSSQRKVKGLTMWEFDPLAMTLEEAKIEDVKVDFADKVYARKIHHKLIYKEGCVYIQALNKKNAYKKIAKRYKNFKMKN